MRRTSDVLLFRCRFVWVGSLLDVHDKLGFSLVLVHWSCRVVDFIAIHIVCAPAAPLTREPKAYGLQYRQTCNTTNTPYMFAPRYLSVSAGGESGVASLRCDCARDPT